MVGIDIDCEESTSCLKSYDGRRQLAVFVIWFLSNYSHQSHAVVSDRSRRCGHLQIKKNSIQFSSVQYALKRKVIGVYRPAGNWRCGFLGHAETVLWRRRANIYLVRAKYTRFIPFVNDRSHGSCSSIFGSRPRTQRHRHRRPPINDWISRMILSRWSKAYRRRS